MQKEKRRPTLDELKAMPEDFWRLELIQTGIDARDAGREDVQREALDMLMTDQDITPEKIVALREKLTSGTGSTEIEMQQEVA